jgi:hypothetical protein
MELEVEKINSIYENIFKKYKTKEELKQNINNKECNCLYIFDTDYYNGSDKKLPENTCKLGMTTKQIYTRLNSYSNNLNMRNIEYIQVNYPDKRERLIKGFLKHVLKIYPSAGSEYFTNCKSIIKCLYIIFCNTPDDEILNIYDKYDKKIEDITNIFKSLYDKYFENIINNENIDNSIKENILENNIINDDNNIYVCEFCKKEYTSISNLKYHQKNTKFCLELQSQQANLKCEYCDKVFSTSKYLKQHSNHCKIYRIYQENESLKIKISEYQVKLDKQEIEYKVKLDNKESEFKLKLENKETDFKSKLEIKEKDFKSKLEIKEKDFKSKLENKESEFKKNLDYQEKETKLKLKNKDDIIKLKDDNINKLEKEINNYKKLATKPINTTNNNNYQIQFNQLLEKIETLNSENICKKLDSINIKELTDPDIKDFQNIISKILSCIFKDFTFCTDRSRKTVVIKNNNREVKKIQLNELIQIGLNYSIQNIIDFITEIQKNNNNEELKTIKDYFLEKKNKNTEVYLTDGNYPLPSLVKNTLSNCAHLVKGN